MKIFNLYAMLLAGFLSMAASAQTKNAPTKTAFQTAIAR